MGLPGRWEQGQWGGGGGDKAFIVLRPCSAPRQTRRLACLPGQKPATPPGLPSLLSHPWLRAGLEWRGLSLDLSPTESCRC